ncbi:MAG: hypothetical protein AB7F98_12460 [Novosphingobium sp.]
MKRWRLLGGAALALSSVWALAQDAPESLLPPGFDRPAPKAGPTRSPAPTPAPAPAPVTVNRGGGSSGGGAVVQAVPAVGASADRPPADPSKLPSGVRIPSIAELEKLTPEEFDQRMGLTPKFDMPPAARRAMKRVGILAESEGGLPALSLAKQNASLVKAALERNKGNLVSRWGHILLRRALASRMDAPAGMNPADFVALRAGLLVRMGEGEAARSLVQDVDSGNYTPGLTQAAFDAYVATADITGICPVMALQAFSRKDAPWEEARSICSAFRGSGEQALAQLDKFMSTDQHAKIDVLLAQKYAGAASRARRAVTIEWDDVDVMTPWRYALTIGTGLEPPASLMRNASASYDYTAATAPMLALAVRAAAADRAGGAGVLSSAAMVDLYSQIYADEGSPAEWSARAADLRDAYVGGDAAARMAAIRKLWDGASDPGRRYSRQVLTAYAAARMPANNSLADDAPELIASMLAAGLDRNAMRWAPFADSGGQAWALLVLAAPERSAPVPLDSLEKFYGDDGSPAARKSAFLLAALAGLNRVSPETRASFSSKLGVDLNRQTKWTAMIEKAGDVNNSALVALLAGLGMQGNSWEKMTPLYLYHVVHALQQVGLNAEARMIAAEAVARG